MTNEERLTQRDRWWRRESDPMAALMASLVRAAGAPRASLDPLGPLRILSKPELPLRRADMSRNVEAVKAIYESFGRGDVPGVLARLDPDVEWEHDWGRRRP
jgi:hypothetical protein